ncbi:MAG TPA: ferritin-like domain-containing protein [Methylomirabilota bacterium]|nr:ferritin-like domain-containing protein [Methylomirabilota bacterium]
MTNDTRSMGLLAYYREAEIRSADLLQRLLRQVDETALLTFLTRQLAEEARHIQLWTEILLERGGSVAPKKRNYRRLLQQHAGAPASTCELLALLRMVEESVQRRYREHAARGGTEPRLVQTLEQIATDEEWHLAGVATWLTALTQKEGRTRLAALLEHYRNAEAQAYAELLMEEAPSQLADLQAVIILR